MIGHELSNSVLKYGLACFGLAFLMSQTAHAECYVYDDLGRMVTTEYDNTTKAREYTLDKHGNRVKVDTVVNSTHVCDEPSGTTSTGQSAAYVYTNGTSGSSSSGNGQAPIADDENITIMVGDTFVVTPLVGDTDPDGDDDDLFISDITSSSTYFSATHTSASVTVNALSAGTGTINYTVSDLDGNTDIGKISVTVTLTDPNLPPDPCASDPNAPGCQ